MQTGIGRSRCADISYNLEFISVSEDINKFNGDVHFAGWISVDAGPQGKRLAGNYGRIGRGGIARYYILFNFPETDYRRNYRRGFEAVDLI